MKKTLCYRCIFTICLFVFLPPPALALQWGDFTYTDNGSAITITGYVGTGGHVDIPASIDGKPVESILWAFSNCYCLTSVSIPASVTYISDGTFGGSGLQGLTNIMVDASNLIYSSQDGVLYNKDKTTLIQYPIGKSGAFIVPDSVTEIGNNAFEGCTGLTSLTIGNNVCRIGDGAFDLCSNLTTITIPDSVTSIGEMAFDSCTRLTSIIMGKGLTSIGAYAFICTGLTSVVIPESVTNIGNFAFATCPDLTSVTIEGNVTNWGIAWFGYCPNLSNLNLGQKCSKIGEQAFAECTGLTSVVIPDSVTEIGNNAFEGCTGLTSLTIGTGVKSMWHAFGGCTGLTNLTLKNGLTYIGENWFSGLTGLTSVTIPDSVTGIGENTFAYCSNLTSAYFCGNAPYIHSNSFYLCASSFTVYYNEESTGFTNPWYGYPTTIDTTGACLPTIIALSSFTATPKSAKVNIAWSTESEIDNAGFNLYRSELENGDYTKINSALIPAQGSPTQGASYTFTDDGLQNRKTYWYKLEDIDLSGTAMMHGPVSATPLLIYGLMK